MKPDEWKLYEFICRHFCSTILPNAVIQEISNTFSVGKEIFHYKGKRLKSQGYLQALPWLAKHYSGLTQFKIGESIKLSTITIEKAKVFFFKN